MKKLSQKREINIKKVKKLKIYNTKIVNLLAKLFSFIIYHLPSICDIKSASYISVVQTIYI